jgi:choloylglycine hydrolase
MCTRILWNDNDLAVLVGRTMDWPESTEPVLTVLPRGLTRRGGFIGPVQAVPENPVEWVARYGSVVVAVYGLGAADGMNEQGLAAHMLFFTDTDFGVRDPAIPGIQAGLWAQYLLDNAANVREALALLDGVQFVMVEERGRKSTVHLGIEDASGDSAVIQYIDGKPVVHHGREFTMLTNAPSYSEQLALLRAQDFSNPSSDMPLPGNVNSIDRFQRGSYYRALLPKPATKREAVAGILSVARNVSVPFGAPYKDFGIYNTEYRTVLDLTNRRYFFELTNSPSLIWLNLDSIDFAPGAPVMTLNPDDITLAGNVTDKLQPIESAPF